jgi:hypothetical protein
MLEKVLLALQPTVLTATAAACCDTQEKKGSRIRASVILSRLNHDREEKREESEYKQAVRGT